MLRPASCFLALCAPVFAQAIINFGLTNSDNLTSPGGGLPFDSVAQVENNDGTSLSGSAVYLGNGYMLTANHVSMRSFVTFDNGSTYIARDLSYTPQQVAPNVDMKIFRLAQDPGVTPVNLLETGSELASVVTLVGGGVGRDPSTPVDSDVVPWGNSGPTAAKRWGENVLEPLVVNLGYQSGSYEALFTVAGSSNPGTVQTGVGDTEAGATLFDSGSALFQNIVGQWFLIGLTTSVSTNGSTTFDEDTFAVVNNTLIIDGGDLTFYARVSSYADNINAIIIPEPAHSAAVLGLLLAVVWRRRCSGHR